MPDPRISAEISPAAISQLLQIQLAVFLALLAAGLAAHKILQPMRARRAVSELGNMSWRAAGVVLIVAVGAEFLAAAALVVPAYRTAGALAVAGIWGIYSTAIARAIGRGRSDVDCGCSFAATHRPLGRPQLLRSGALFLLALAVATLSAATAGRAGSGQSAAVILCEACAAIALLGVYAALDHVTALGSLRAGVIR